MKLTVLLKLLGITMGSVLMIMSISHLSSYRANQRTATVFADHQPLLLTNQNLVDQLVKLKLTVRLSKADVEGAILSIDLKVTKQQFNEADVYAAMAEIIAFSFERTSNIDQLLLRVMGQDEWTDSKYLLLAADVRRGGWPSSALTDLKLNGNQALSPELQHWFKITETHLWKKKLYNEYE